MSLAGVRCQLHDLACGPDGRCVLCRRNKAAEGGRSPKYALLGITVATVLAATGAGALAYRAREASGPPTTAPLYVLRTPPFDREEPSGRTPGAVEAPFAPADSNRERGADWLRAAARGTPAASATALPGSATPLAAGAETAPAEALPTEATTARPSIAGVPVIVYTTSWCPVCRRAKAWLTSNGIAYQERDIEVSSEYARKIRLLNPRASIPTFDIDGDVAIGFSEDHLTSMLERAAQRRSSRR